MHKYINADELIQQRPENLSTTYIDNDIAQYNRGWNACNKLWFSLIKEMFAADVEPVRHDLIERVKKYAADMEERYTEVCADFRERTGQDYVCGACKYGDCVYLGADGDYCGECPGFESDECFVLSDELKRKIWEIVDIVSGAKMNGDSE